MFVLSLVVLFIVKHFICDFILQSDRMIKEKGTYGAAGGRDHALVHAAGTILLLFIVLPWNLAAHMAAIILGLVDGVIHYHIDWSKSKINTRFNLYPEWDKMFWWLLGADQMLHYLTYVFIIYILVVL